FSLCKTSHPPRRHKPTPPAWERQEPRKTPPRSMPTLRRAQTKSSECPPEARTSCRRNLLLKQKESPAAVPDFRSPVFFARISFVRTMVKRGRTTATKCHRSKNGPVLLGRHSGSRAILVMGFSLPITIDGLPQTSPSQVPPKRNRKPGSAPLSGASFMTAAFGFLIREPVALLSLNPDAGIRGRKRS